MSDTTDASRAFAFPALIGDIGGTNARFALIDGPEAETVRFADVHTADFVTIDDAIVDVLATGASRPKSATLALAGPIAGDAVPLTNCDWVVEPKRLIERLGLDEVVLLNDFEAQSLCLPDLGRDDLDVIGEGSALPDSARVVLGPGTGLGAGALVNFRGTWIPVPGEGGHIDLGPVTPRDMAIWPYFERAHGRMSAEALLSGHGLVRLHKGVATFNGGATALTTPAQVAAAGLSGEDANAAEALQLFATYLGRFAGDLAMIFMARGGVYLAGGIPARIAPVLKSGAFREAFVAKEPHRELLEDMMTAIVIKPDAALAGIGAYVRAPSRFGVALAGRHWKA